MERGTLRVLVVEGDLDHARGLSESASALGWEVETCDSLETALARLVKGELDAALFDLRVPDAPGVAAAACVAAAFPSLPVIVLADLEGESAALAALRAGAQDVLLKSRSSPPELDRAVRYALERSKQTATVRSLEKAVHTMQLGVSITDRQGRIVYVNPAEAEIHGYAVDELLGRDARSLSPRADWNPLPPEELPKLRKWKRERVRERKDGSVFPVQLMSDVVTDHAGQPLGIVTTCEDITERRRAQEALRESEERYALAVRGTNDGIWDWNLKTDRIYLSPRWKAMVGHEDAEIGDSPDDWFSRVHPEDAERVRGKVQAHLSGTLPFFEDEFRLRHKDASYRWVLSRGFALRDEDGRPTRMAGAQTDVTDRRAYDPLTALPNRALFSERLAEALARARRRGGYFFAVVFLDLDHFKSINDTHGHSAGDAVLIAVAKRLQASVRPGDTVARLAGDEFAILLDRIADVDDATLVVDRVQGELAVPVPWRSGQVPLSASMGIALSTAGYQKADDLLRDADAAMYRAKQSGRQRYEIFDEPLRQRLAARLQLEEDLVAAVRREGFRLYYQPVVELTTLRLTGFEALLRWPRPDGRVLLPGEFLEAAETGGHIAAIGSWALHEACRQLVAWRASSPAAATLSVSVNLSLRQFARRGLAEQVEEALARSGLPASALELEVLETTLLEGGEAVASVLARLRALGIKVLLDNFGTGYSSLAHLPRFPVDALKLDRSVVGALESGGEALALVQSVLTLAASRGLEAIAEGVETAAQLGELRSQRCDKGQGFLFAAALEPPLAAGLIAAGPTVPLGA